SVYCPAMVKSPEQGPEERLRQLEAVTDVGLARLGVEDLLGEVLERVRKLLSIDTAAVLLVDVPSQHLVATAAVGLEEEVRQGVRIPIGVGFAGRVAAGKRAIILDHVDRSTVVNPVLWERGVCSMVGVPMFGGGEVVGVLHVGSLTSRRFTDTDLELIQLAADRAALASLARRTAVEHVAARMLERSLIPSSFPAVPGVEFAGRYVPADDVGVGGDWYDAFGLADGWCGVMVGDVVGRGLFAATVMGRMRSTMRAYALECDDPAEVITRVDRKMRHFEPDAIATVLYAMLEPSTGRMLISSAGHLPPVLASPAAPTRLLEPLVDPPIGTTEGTERRTTVVELPAGALLGLYSDGLVERRSDPSIDTGLERLCKVVIADVPEVVCATTMASLVGAGPIDDDVTLLAIRLLEG
ncbi:MAG: PP2C family protein-serine/threonine phosphatase, partial [Nocardioidaceae bacterium]